jgi:tetratricopeptide (TPR) repeat protein
MTPKWRDRILSKDGLTPIAALSGAFRGAEKPEDLLFAYFQSAMVVDYLVASFGEDSFCGLLRRLGKGEPVNDALAASYEPIPSLEAKFAAYAKHQAERYGPGVDWTALDELPTTKEPLETHPSNYWIRQAHTLALLGSSRWEEAIASARVQIELFPDYAGDDNGWALLARGYRGLGQDRQEADALREWMRRSAAASPACLRLVELDRKSADWEKLKEAARHQLAINPFVKSAHYALGCAGQATGDAALAIDSFEKLLILKPENPAEVHFRLGQLLAQNDPEKARRQVIEALLEAPRYGEAHELLAQLHSKAQKS